MTAHSLSAPQRFHAPAWLRRTAVVLLLFAGACLAYLPYSLYPVISRDARPAVWGGITALLLAAALLARRSQRFCAYWLAMYGFFVASAANLADWYLSDWLTGLLGVPVHSPAGYGLALLESALVVAVCVIVLVKLAGADLGSLLLKRGKVRWWLPIGLLGFGFFALTVVPAAMNLFGGKDVTWQRILPWVPWVLMFVLSNGLREELMYRGLMLPRLTPLVGAAPTLLLTSVVFSLAHVSVDYTPMVVVFLGITFVLGLVFGTLAHKTDSLWGAVLVHAGADIPVIVGILSNL